MDLIIQGVLKALHLLLTLDREVVSVVFLTLKVSGTATALSVVIGCSTGTALALTRFPGRTVLIALVNMGMGLPPVVVGLFVTLLIWRSGPLGFLGLLYTPAAMIAAQTVIAVPIVTGISLAAIQQLPRELPMQLMALGATRAQMVWMMVKQARLPLMAAVMAGFGGAVSEIGASLMVGGNIKGHTRVLTTATVMETGKGNFDTAIALGLILLALTFGVSLILTRIQQRGGSR